MSELVNELKQLIINSLNLEDITAEDIGTDTLLFSEQGLGLDSIDALELGISIHKKYQVKLNAESQDTRNYFQSVASLAKFIEAHRSSH